MKDFLLNSGQALVAALVFVVVYVAAQKRQQIRPIGHATPASSQSGSSGGLSRQQWSSSSAVDFSNSDFNSDETRLQQFILEGYRDIVRPAKYSNETVIVVTRIFPMKVQDLVEKDEVLHLALRLQFGWMDKRLRWNPANFSGLQSIILPGHSVWIPDLQFINSADDMYAMLASRQFPVKVHNDGSVWWHPTGSMKLRCELNLQLFPYDHQRCKVVLESVIYTHDQLNLTIRQNKTVSFSMYRENGLWEVTNGIGTAMLNWATSSTAFSRVEFVLHMQRRTSYYVNNYIIPCFLLSCLQVLTFLIPLRNPERLTHATSVLLSLIVFQTIMFSELPKTASSMPLLARYLLVLSIVSVLAITSCVVVSHLLAMADDQAQRGRLIHVPKFVVHLLSLKIIDPTNVNGNRLHTSRIEGSPAVVITQHQQHCNGGGNAANGNGGILLTRHRLMSGIDSSYNGATRLSCNNSPMRLAKSCDQPKKRKSTRGVLVRGSKFYRKLAKHIDALSFFVSTLVILGAPMILFWLAPIVWIVDGPHN